MVIVTKYVEAYCLVAELLQNMLADKVKLQDHFFFKLLLTR